MVFAVCIKILLLGPPSGGLGGIEAELAEDHTKLFECCQGGARWPDDHALTAGLLEHPDRDDETGIVGQHADVDPLTATNFVVENIDVLAGKRVPSVSDPRPKFDMGRMS